MLDNPRFLQQIFRDLRPDDGSGWCELHLQVFTKPAGVIIDRGAGISEGFDQRVDLQDLLPQTPVVSLREASSARDAFSVFPERITDCLVNTVQ